LSTLSVIAHTALIATLGLGLFAAGHYLLATLLRPARLHDELFAKDNPAIGAVVVGYDLGLVLSLGPALIGESQDWKADLATVAEYGLGAIGAFYASAWLGRAVVVGRMDLIRELTADRNAGLGSVFAGYLVASGMLIHGVLSGEGGGWLGALVFLALAQAVLLIAGPVYGRIVGYGLREQLRRDNAAAGLAYGGCLVGIGIILGQLLSSDFVSWGESLSGFAAYALGGLIGLPAVRWLADLILAPGVRLSHEIAAEGPDAAPNLAAGLLEAVSYIAAGLLVAWSL
jgi:uncharacterized membrane protein YjfL (UPF0719 family)